MATTHLTRAFRHLTIGVTIASAVLSGLCGAIAPAAYVFSISPEGWDKLEGTLFHQYCGPVGIALGIVGGIAAGLLWSFLMRWITVRSIKDRGYLPGLAVVGGAALGLMVAIMATVGLHLGLAALSGFRFSPKVDIGLWFGVPVGLVLGLISGAIWVRSVTKAQQADLDATASSSAAMATPPSREEPR